MLRLSLTLSGPCLALACLFTFHAPLHAATATIGAPAPAWQLTDVHGQVVRSSDLLGKVVLINFFRTTCAPCAWEVADFSALQEQYRLDGLVVVGVAVQQEPSVLFPYMAENGINYTVCPSVDSILWNYNVLPIGAIPLTTIIDRQGIVVDWYRYYHEKAHHESILKPLLAAAPPTLHLNRTASEMEFSWTTNSSGFLLESGTSYTAGAPWTQVTNATRLTNGMYRVRIPARGPAAFFRLRKNP